MEKIISAVSRANAMVLLNSLAKQHEHYHAPATAQGAWGRPPDATYITHAPGTADLTSGRSRLPTLLSTSIHTA